MRDPLNRNFPPHPSLAKAEATPRGLRRRRVNGATLSRLALESLQPPFAVIDLETTGLDPNRHEIIEIASLRIEAGFRIASEYTTLVRPLNGVPEHITRLTGIDQGLLDRAGILPQKALAELFAFLGLLPAFAHNASFDEGFLVRSAQRYDLSFWPLMHDSINVARVAWPGLASYSLSSLVEHLGLSHTATHRALGDARATLKVLIEANKLRQPPHGYLPDQGVK